MALTDKEEKHVKKLQQILTKLQNDEHVQNRTLKNCLTDDEFESISEQWEEQKELREELKDKPAQIKEYEKRFKKAEFAYSKANDHSLQGNRKAAKNGFKDAESQFERLLVYLEEILYSDPSLAECFDREICFEHGKEPSIDPVGMPRTITSRSNNRQSDNDRMQTKNQIKQNVVSFAIEQIEYQLSFSTSENEHSDIDIKEKLKHLLDKIKRDS